MARIASPQRRRQWLIMTWTSGLLTIIFLVPGGVLMHLALARCPKDQFNSLGQCIPWSTIMWTCGPLFLTLGGMSLIWFVVMVCLKYTQWYTRNNGVNVDNAEWEDSSRETIVVDGKRYVANGFEKTAIVEEKKKERNSSY